MRQTMGIGLLKILSIAVFCLGQANRTTGRSEGHEDRLMLLRGYRREHNRRPNPRINISYLTSSMTKALLPGEPHVDVLSINLKKASPPDDPRVDVLSIKLKYEWLTRPDRDLQVSWSSLEV